MAAFDGNGAFTSIRNVDVRNNEKLNVSMDFNYLSGIEIEYLYLTGTAIHDKVDFGYISNYLFIEMDITVHCVSSECNNEPGGRTVSWDRLNSSCKGQDECRDTCDCVTRYEAGLDSYRDGGIEAAITLGAGIGIAIIVCCVCIGITHCRTGILSTLPIGGFHSHDDFNFKSILAFCFQLWDFLSDLLLCFSIYDHYYQESFDSPKKAKYLRFFFASAAFVFIPWFINLIFLWLEVRQWQKKASKIQLKKEEHKNKNKSTKKKKKKKIFLLCQGLE